MTFSALVIGFGSIGKRHADIMNNMNEIGHLSVLSSQSSLAYETIYSLKDVTRIDPDYVVITSPTNLHYPQLKFLEEHLQGKKILVEKPLFDSMVEFKVRNNEVVVGYNLRFHPLIQKIRETISGKKLWSLHAFCGSYLPDWRPGRDYRETSSVKKASGGGVLLDLSHELDYVQWLAGPLEVEYVVSEKVSDLEIDSDDLLIFFGRAQGGACVQISLNYFTREPVRQIILDGEGVSIQGDLIANSLSAMVDGEKSDYSWPDLESNYTYRAMHRAFLDEHMSFLCSYDQGLQTMALIERIRSWSKG